MAPLRQRSKGARTSDLAGSSWRLKYLIAGTKELSGVGAIPSKYRLSCMVQVGPEQLRNLLLVVWKLRSESVDETCPTLMVASK
jgi:hypothetical protein